MGVIQKMRDKAGLMVVLVGGAMVLFILSDLLGSLFAFGEDYSVIGKVGDYDIKTQDYQNYVGRQNQSDDKQKENAHVTAWNEYVKYFVYQHVFNTVHISYSDQERNNRLYEDVHPNVMSMVMQWDRQIFQGKYGFNFMSGGDAIRTMISENEQNPNLISNWNYFADNTLRETVKSEKYINMIKSGMFVTTKMAEKLNLEKKDTYKVRYVAKRLRSINDTIVEVSEQEMRDYYNANLSKYESKPTRDIKYVEFKVDPSDDDYKKTYDDVQFMADELAKNTVGNAFEYATNMGGQQDRKYYTKEELKAKNLDTLFTGQNIVTGPERIGNSWVINTAADKRMIPDSVKAAHILIKAENRSQAEGKVIADSLFAVFAKDTTGFAEAAKKHSEGPSNVKGGDLGWFKQEQMVPAFNDSCFYGKKGQLKIALTRFGYHVILIKEMSKKTEKVRLASIQRNVEPSKRTYDMFRTKSSKFARGLETTEQFEEAVLADVTLFNANANALTATSHEIIGLKNARNIVLWAFGAQVGSVSRPFELSGSFVVATVTGANETSYKPFEMVKDIIAVELRNEKKRKLIIDEMQQAMAGASSLEDLSTELNLGGYVSEDPNARFTNNGLQGFANDKEILGRLESIEDGKMVGPFASSTAVFVLIVEKNQTTPEEGDVLADDVMEMNSTIDKAVNADLIEAYKEILGVEDRRLEVFTALGI